MDLAFIVIIHRLVVVFDVVVLKGQERRSIDSRQSTLRRHAFDYISTRRCTFVEEHSICTLKRETLIIRKRMTYFAFYVSAMVP